MKVLLKYDWFAPSEETTMELGNKNPRKVSGTFFKAGTHEMSDNLKGKLPKSATIIDDGMLKAVSRPDATNTLRSFDEARANSDAFNKVLNKLDKR